MKPVLSDNELRTQAKLWLELNTAKNFAEHRNFSFFRCTERL